MIQSISKEMLYAFQTHLSESEKADATISKYMRDIAAFATFAGETPLNKSLILAYKTHLANHYAYSSANSMLAALNVFLRFMNCPHLCVQPLRIQKKIYCAQEQELTHTEYTRLLATAKKHGNERLYLLLQTICGCGIRVSELAYITVNALHIGQATVHCKGKQRTVFIVSALRRHLLEYAASRGITDGAVFVTKSGKPLDRSNIWRDMKSLCDAADVLPQKVFPHNLRHLFARTFYDMDKDIATLADILGHTSINTTRLYIMSTGAQHQQRLETMHLVV